MNERNHEMIKAFIKNELSKVDPVSTEMVETLYKQMSIKRLKKGECFISAGDIPESLAFNLKGLLRLYYIDESGNDFTKGFSVPGMLTMSYSAMVKKRESFYSIEALKASELLVIHYNDWMALAENNKDWYIFMFKLLEKMYMMKEQREKSFLLEDAATRYKDFLMANPLLIKEIKKYHMASYLRMTPETLSRIRKKF